MSIPGYDAWKLATPPEYEASPEQEREMQYREAGQRADLRDAIATALADYRCDLYLADVRRVVIEELNKLSPLPGEPK